MKLPTREQCLDLCREWNEEIGIPQNDHTQATGHQFIALIHRAYKAGAETAWEEAAKVCDEHPDGMNMLGGAFVTCANAIRNLKVEDV